jgi:2-keto-myo-inositol isomerase
MPDFTLNRRQALGALAGAAAWPVTAARPATAEAQPAAPAAFTYCLNMSTIRGEARGFVKELEIASKAGFRSVEIWMNTLQDYLKTGATSAQARRVLADLGLKAENAIGFAPWIVDDEATRTKGLDQLRREMDLLAEVGCPRIAAPPMGATQGERLDLYRVAERYRATLELGRQTGVVPHLELWGFSKNLSRLSEVLFVAAESGHPQARVLLDVYHLYKGGSVPASLPLVGKPAMEIFHLNDYPAQPPRETIGDADRVYPGDGIAPIRDILKTIRTPGQTIVLSLELFNKTYYAQDPLAVAKTGLAKMKALTAGL